MRLPFRSLLVLNCLAALVLSDGSSVFAQGPPRFEAGPIISCVADCSNRPDLGWGARGTVNLSKVFAAEFQIFSHNGSTGFNAPSDVFETFNLKATWRLERRYKFNLFALAGPGIVNTNTDEDNGAFAPLTTTRRHLFMLDLGGGAEFVPVRNFAFRLDVTHFTFTNPCIGDLYCFTPSFDERPPLGGTTVKAGFMIRFP